MISLTLPGATYPIRLAFALINALAKRQASKPIDLSQRHKKMSGMFIKSVTSRLGCLGLPELANFPLKCMEIYVAFDRLPLPRIGEFPYCLHTSRKC